MLYIDSMLPAVNTLQLTPEFIEEIEATIIEGEFLAHIELIKTYQAVGKRIKEEVEEYKYPITALLQTLAVNLNCSERKLFYAVAIFNKYPTEESLPEGKNITLSLLINKYLPREPKQITVKEPLTTIFDKIGKRIELLIGEYPLEAVKEELRELLKRLEEL